MEKPYGYVYCVTNRLSGKFYIGLRCASTVDESYWGSGVLVTLAVRKYGTQAFSRRILQWCDSKEALQDAERQWIRRTDAVASPYSYNLSEGGAGGSRLIFSESHRKRLSESKTGTKHPMFGKSLPKRHKRKLSQAATGKKFSDEHRAKISAARRAYWAARKAEPS